MNYRNYSGLLLLVLFFSCKSNKTPSFTGDEPVSFKAFTSLFPQTSLPFHVADSSFKAKINDSLAIKPKLFAQFVADSIQLKAWGKSAPRIFPAGMVAGDANYLFIKSIAADKRAVWVFAFDKKDQLITWFPFIQLDNLPATQQFSVFDRKYAIYKTITRKNADGSVSEGRDVWDLDPELGNFSLVYTDALDEKKPELVNPIDTFPRKHKFSGDYGVTKTNIISFRDGRKSDRLSFFLHFEKGADCSGELKGEAIFRSASTAEYREPGDPCSILFTFSANAITIKEIEGCGAHRGLRCSFDGRFAKKKVAKPSPKNTRK